MKDYSFSVYHEICLIKVCFEERGPTSGTQCLSRSSFLYFYPSALLCVSESRRPQHAWWTEDTWMSRTALELKAVCICIAFHALCVLGLLIFKWQGIYNFLWHNFKAVLKIRGLILHSANFTFMIERGQEQRQRERLSIKSSHSNLTRSLSAVLK